ncbi:MAG: phosphate ABC transporter substrate-binding protein [Ignavibacteriales bacterium]|nr:phosphate ABC transporter substrate-binding protein [Ignavibacteriales bacterium]
MKTIKTLLVLGLVILAFGFQSSKTTITVKGSDTLVILAQRWAEIYMKQKSNVSIQVNGGGSGVGISALINGTTDITTSSRPMKDSEKQKLKEKYNSNGVEIKVARDGITIFVHQSNPIKSITMQQLKDIYTGKTTNWKALGGKDQKIIAYGRENSSGTYQFFMEHVLTNEDFAPMVQTLPGTAAVVNTVSKDKYGIGYGGSAYGKGVKHIAVKADDKSPAMEPTEKNIKSGSYPISRFLYMYTRVKPTGEIKSFIDWALGKEGQKLVAEVGYFPVK